ncbi:MAG TPA: hypothetical protein VGK67_15610 [Myxococcales bacterium]|jgi:hypothetical protein
MDPRDFLATMLADERLRRAASQAARRAKNLLAPAASFGVLRFARWRLADSASLPAPDGFAGRELRADELAGAARAFSRHPGSFHRRARLGDRCFAAFLGERIVNLRWAATRPIEVPELDLFVCLPQGEVYFYAAMTLPAFQGRRAAAVTRRAMEGALAAEGHERGCAYVSLDNFASVRTRHPFHEVLFDLGYLRLRGGRAHVFGEVGPPVYRESDIPSPLPAPLPDAAPPQSRPG